MSDDTSERPVAAPDPTGFDRLLKIGLIAALAVAVLVWPARLWLGSQATEVRLVTPLGDPKLLPLQKQQFETDLAEGYYEGQPIELQSDLIAVYGTLTGETEEVVFVDDAVLVRHELLEGPPLLLHDQSEGNVFLMDRVRFLSVAISAGAALGALLLAALLWWRASRRRSSAA